MFTKANRPGWAALIPIYNMIVLSEIVYNNGAKIFLLLVPIYNIYFIFRYSIDLAHAYGKSTGFGVFAAFFPPLAIWILGFGNAQYVLNGTADMNNNYQAPVMNEVPVTPEVPTDGMNNNQTM